MTKAWKQQIIEMMDREIIWAGATNTAPSFPIIATTPREGCAGWIPNYPGGPGLVPLMARDLVMTSTIHFGR